MNVLYPIFELTGPPCKNENCKGVLIDHLTLHTKEFFRRCSVCEGEFDRQKLGPITENINDNTIEDK